MVLIPRQSWESYHMAVANAGLKILVFFRLLGPQNCKVTVEMVTMGLAVK
jgi:hypothetical protein